MTRAVNEIVPPAEMEDGAAMRLGLVGCGRLAELAYLPALKRTRAIRLGAVADVNRSRCRFLAPEVRAFTGVREMIDAGGIDGLIICTPTRFHLGDAQIAANAGLPALLEKPPGANIEEAQALCCLRPAPWIGFNRRFDLALNAVKSAEPEHQLLELELHYRRSSWNPFDMHDDALLDLGPHLIDLARWLTKSEIASIRAISLDPHRAQLELKLERGRAVVTCSDNSYYRERIVIRDARGRVRKIRRRGGIISAISGKLIAKRDNPLVELMIRQLEAFASAARTGRGEARLATAADGLAVMAAIEAARRSAASNGIECSVRPAVIGSVPT
jgi:myo-inositol 2-dehydrogenase/D-chiro-inositol 1-dehydrogenase